MMARKIRRAWIHVIIDSRAVWLTLLELVDSRTVRLFQAIVYFWCALAGIYAALFSEPTSIVDHALGSAYYTVWVWLNILCPLIVLIGCYIPHRARGKGNGHSLTPSVTNGLILQLGGNLGMTITFGTYVSALLSDAWWGKGTYAVFLTAALAMCAALLVVGDVRRLVTRSEWNRK